MTKSTTRQAADVAHVVGRKNLIINGGFDVWQRGASTTSYSSSIGGFIADRWKGRYASLMERSTDVPSGKGFKYSLAVTTVSDIDPWVLQGIENIDRFAGLEVTLSYWIKPSITTTLRDDYLAGGHGGHNVTANVWQHITNTFTVPLSVATDDTLFIQLPVSTVATYLITGVQLELGSVATDFEHRFYGEELALCQRYFYQMSSSGSGYIASITNRSVRYMSDKIPSMRGTPTLSYDTAQVSVNGGSYTNVTPSMSSYTDGGNVLITLGAGSNDEDVLFYGNLKYDAEL